MIMTILVIVVDYGDSNDNSSSDGDSNVSNEGK